MSFKKILLLIIIFSLFFFLLTNSVVLATGGQDEEEDKPKSIPGTVSLTNPLTGDQTPSSPQELIGRIINAVLSIVGSIALAMFIYGGFTWMTAAGGAEKVQKGKDILIWATLGLVIIFSAYALVNFVIQKAILGTA